MFGFIADIITYASEYAAHLLTVPLELTHPFKLRRLNSLPNLRLLQSHTDW